MMKLEYSNLSWVSLDIYQDEKGKYWGVERDSTGRYMVSEYDAEI